MAVDHHQHHSPSLLGSAGWAGLIAFVLAFGISVALAASIIIIALTPRNLDEPLASVITALAGAAVGAISTYIGTMARPAITVPPAEPDASPREPGQPPDDR